MSIRDEEHALNLEILEHETRKDFSRAERIDYAKRLERIESIKARERQATSTGGELPQLRDNFPEAGPVGRVRDVVASRLGIGSGKQYEREKFIVENRSSLPPEDFADWDEGRLSTNSDYSVWGQKCHNLYGVMIHDFILEKTIATSFLLERRKNS
ncbi:MAG: hypothetical protein Q4F21_13155 [Lachnospiraceae bacterium]|nr:hypothetical protein [Lachnospiraceae bacterium]